MHSAGEGEARQRGLAVVEQLIGTAALKAVAFRLDPQIQIHGGEGGFGCILPGAEILLPIVPRFLFRVSSLNAVEDGEPEQDAHDERHEGERRQPQEPPGGGRSLEPVECADGVFLPAIEGTYRDRDEEERQPQGEEPVQDQGLAVELQRSHVGPAHRAPEHPVADPIHTAGELPVERKRQRSQGDAIGHEALTGHRLHTGYEGGPEQQSGNEQ